MASANVKWGVAQGCCSFPSTLKAQHCKSHSRNVWVYIVSSYQRPWALIKADALMRKVPVSQWLENNEVTHETLILLCTHNDILITYKPTNYNLLNRNIHSFHKRAAYPGVVREHQATLLVFPKDHKNSFYDKHMLTVTIYSSSSTDYVNFCCLLVSSQVLHPIKSM